MQEQETTPTKGNKYEELGKLQDELKALTDKIIKLPTDVFTVPEFQNLVDEKLVKLRSKLFECIWRVGEIRTFYYLKEI